MGGSDRIPSLTNGDSSMKSGTGDTNSNAFIETTKPALDGGGTNYARNSASESPSYATNLVNSNVDSTFSLKDNGGSRANGDRDELYSPAVMNEKRSGKMAPEAEYQSNGNGKKKTGDDEFMDDATIENTAQEFSNLLFSNSAYEHDEDGNLVVEKKIHQPMQFMASILEKVRAKELFEMESQTREAINNEIHGIESRSIPETPHMVSEALRQLQIEIDQQDNDDMVDEGLFSKRSYRRGLELRSDYILSDAFRIRFLRAGLFDIPKAATLYFRYLDVLHTWFGDEALTRPLFLTDLTKHELTYLRKGEHQILPSRDRSGRRVLCFLGFSGKGCTIDDKFRIRTYLFEVLAQCEVTQKLGFVSVGIMTPSGAARYTDSDHHTTLGYHLKRWLLSCPCRSVAFHLCCQSSVFMSLLRGALFVVMHKDDRAKVRVHIGSQIENNFHLSGFGISPGDIPLTYDGTIKYRIVAKFVRARKTIESFQKQQIKKTEEIIGTTGSNIWTNSNESLSSNRVTKSIILGCPIMECPCPNQVVFGDKDMYDHPANVRIRRLVLQLEQRRMERIANCDETLSVSVSGFIDEIVHEARSLNGLRFFSYDKEHFIYKEIDDMAELNKRFLRVLRDVRKRTKQRGSKETNATQEQSVGQGRKARSESMDLGDGSSILGLDPYKRSKTNGGSPFCLC